ncbi:extracellular solute-binding protein [Thorsellia kenyensis]|uniref:Extracellular solute-binding protein n=1 Tax=Thorsellia kenyensis TaxID=1549888 RepID=A0ABV6CBM6_9GAMM
MIIKLISTFYFIFRAKQTTSFILFCSISLSALAGINTQNNPTASIEESSTFKPFHAISLLGDPKYPAEFEHFDYVNINAPKGGEIIFSAVGTFDNFNRFALRGVAAQRSGELYDALFTQSLDDPSSFYPLIASKIKVADDLSQAIVELNPQARFHDDVPIKATDVLFTFDKFNNEGVPQFAKAFAGVELEIIDDLSFRIILPRADKILLSNFLTLNILPEHYWQDKNLGEPQKNPPIGSGPYKISEYKMGQYVIYERVKGYWAKDLPVNKGQYNFDKIRYDYYLDANVAFEAFKTGAFDFQLESKAKNWITGYKGPNFANGNIIKVERENTIPTSTQWFVFNINQPKFQDIRVREAISHAFNFEFLNEKYFYQSYTRVNSFFQNSPYSAQGKPSQEEIDILKPLSEHFTDKVFDEALIPPNNYGDPFSRQNLLNALALLKDAGYELIDGKLIDQKTHEQLRFELLSYSGSPLEHLTPFVQALNKIGIQMTIKEVDISQYVKRLRDRDYDMIIKNYPTLPYPDDSLLYYWHSSFIDSTYNAPGVKNPAIDTLIDKIIEAQGDKNRLVILGRALDRILTWQHYMIPQWYASKTRFAYWNKFSMPETYPSLDIGLDTWWFDETKAQSLTK